MLSVPASYLTPELRDPLMLLVSYHEIKGLVTAAIWPKLLTTIGSLLTGAVLSGWITKCHVSRLLSVPALMVLFAGLAWDVGFSITSLRRLHPRARAGKDND